MVDAVAFQSAVAKDLPRFHVGEYVLDTGPDLLVGLVVRLLPGGQFLVLRVVAIWDDQPCSPVAAIGDGGRGANGGLGAGLGPGPAVVAAARLLSATPRSPPYPEARTTSPPRPGDASVIRPLRNRTVTQRQPRRPIRRTGPSPADGS